MIFCEYLFNWCCCYNFPRENNDYKILRSDSQSSNESVMIHHIYNANN